MLSTSVKTLDNTMLFPPQIIPRPFVPGNYMEVLNNRKFNFLMWARNTVIVAYLVECAHHVAREIALVSRSQPPRDARLQREEARSRGIR